MKYLNERLKDETTVNLRQYTEERLDDIETKVKENEDKTEMELLHRFNKDCEIEERLFAFIKEYK